MNSISINGLTKKYGNITAVDNLNLQIRDGELFAMLGVNGAGKSTTIKMLACLTSPTSGDAVVKGHSITCEAAKVRSIIGISPQETAVAPNLTVKENLEFMCGINGFSKMKTNEKTDEISKKLGITDIMSRRAGKLSGGQQRRLSIAMALIGEPDILFLDEPTLGLDVIARSELWDTIKEMKGSVTIILTTHYMEEAEALSDRVGIMKKGRLLITGTANEIKESTGEARFEDAFISLVKDKAV